MPNKRRLKFLSTFVIASICFMSHAESQKSSLVPGKDYPVNGSLISLTTPGARYYKCEPISDKKIICDFTSVNVTKSRNDDSCTINTMNFDEIYKKTGDAWIATDSQPYGECRTVSVSRFERVTSDGRKIRTWKYISKFRNLSPDARDNAGKSCKENNDPEKEFVASLKKFQFSCDGFSFFGGQATSYRDIYNLKH